MKLKTVIGTVIAALSLAACGATVPPTARPATPTPTVAPTPTATPAPTPTATPTATPGVTVTVTCSNVPTYWPYPQSPRPYPPNAILGKATWHGVKIGDSLQFGNDPQPILITSNPFSTGVEGFGNATNAFTQGTWYWDIVSPPPAYVEVTHGTITIPPCPGKSI